MTATIKDVQPPEHEINAKEESFPLAEMSNMQRGVMRSVWLPCASVVGLPIQKVDRKHVAISCFLTAET